MTKQPACTIRRGDFQGWEACILENGLVRLVGVPAIGGRIMAYDLGPYPFFFVDPTLAGKLFTPEENQGDGSLAAWKNYGGDKTWPSPQGWDTDEQWHGPPDPVLDTGRYTVDAFETDGKQAVLSMTSPPDPRTGVQITRRFTLYQSSSRITLDITFTNTLERPIRWSIWDVAQLRAERTAPDGSLTHEPSCIVTTPLNPTSKFERGFNVMFGAEDNPQWQADPASGLFRAPYQWQIGKVGIDSPAGWIAFSNAAEGYGFAERFTFDPSGEYPDEGVTVEVWTIGAGEVGNLNYEGTDIYLMEVEILSPLITIPSGEQAHFTLEWGTCRADAPIVDVSEAGCLTIPLAVTHLTDGYVQVTATGGVFERGILQLVWQDATGATLRVDPVGTVDPLSAISLDQVVQPPANARQAMLQVIATPTGAARPLATVEL